MYMTAAADDDDDDFFAEFDVDLDMDNEPASPKKPLAVTPQKSAEKSADAMEPAPACDMTAADVTSMPMSTDQMSSGIAPDFAGAASQAADGADYYSGLQIPFLGLKSFETQYVTDV